MRKDYDLTGQTFGIWTVIERASAPERYGGKHVKWLCKCKCGNIKIRDSKSIKKCIKDTACEACSGYANLEGQKFGKYLVLRKDKERSGRYIALCECGNEKSTSAYALVNHTTQQCKDCYHKTLSLNLGNLPGTTKRNAETRGLTFNIDKDFMWNLFLKQNKKCALSGVDLKIGHGNYSRETTASLDRIDSSKGYEPDNVQWVHKNINTMKWSFKQEEFLNWCKLITNYVSKDFSILK